MQKIKRISIVFMCLLGLIVNTQNLFAIDDGAYLIGRSTSYVNPLTGQTEDGGSNIALGDSMVSSIVESQLLLEQVNGSLYITVGLGLASNVSNVRFQLMNSNGSKTTVGATLTGSSQANGDTVNHYRIQISSLTQYISPILYVAPMGRDVQFFIQLNTNSITSGTGIYRNELTQSLGNSNANSTITNDANSQMNTNSSEQNEGKKEEDKSEDATTETTENKKVSKKSLFKGVDGLSLHKIKEKTSSSESYWPFVVGGVMGITLLGIGGFYYVKKRKK